MPRFARGFDTEAAFVHLGRRDRKLARGCASWDRSG